MPLPVNPSIISTSVPSTSSRTKAAPSACTTRKRLSSGGTWNSLRSAITCGLISATSMRAPGRWRWQNLASEPPPNPTMAIRRGSGCSSTKPIIVRVYSSSSVYGSCSAMRLWISLTEKCSALDVSVSLTKGLTWWAGSGISGNHRWHGGVVGQLLMPNRSRMPLMNVSGCGGQPGT